MSEDCHTPQGPQDDDALAAEYVLGVLDTDEHTAAARRAEAEPAFAQRVATWQETLAGLDDAFVPVAPPRSAKAVIDGRLFAPTTAAEQRRGPIAALWRSLAVWRIATASFAAACLALLAVIAFTPPEVGPTRTLIASLNPQDGTLQFVAVYDDESHLLRVAHTAGEAPPDHALELWLVPAGSAPVSLGLIDASGGAAAQLDASLAARIINATIAVSLEPPGGSPSGSPTGQVVAAGPTRAL